ncbi:MAG: carbamoyltransferase HypF [Desulfobacterales bacterium]|nr:carbamoyltransferase HypF [Desulfobacterales bacterium]
MGSLGRCIEVFGVVQGVGFRPFVFGLARTYVLSGEVTNTPRGLRIYLEGAANLLDAFVRDLEKKAPPLAVITQVSCRDVPCQGYRQFQIIPSDASGSRNTLISPDVSLCDDCLKEMLDPNNRRYHYPFINCTHCGPRFTIIKDLPYDRPKTSMAVFPMCEDCRAEYEDPLDRRFHAQPNACPVCGPRIWVSDSQGHPLEEEPSRVLGLAARTLARGEILAVKGLGGFHLAVDACQEGAVARLRRRKNRPHKPFALMAPSLESLKAHVVLTSKEEEALTSPQRPIVLLNKSRFLDGEKALNLALNLAPGNACLGVMLPYTPLHVLLLDRGPGILVMTSGNRPGEPLAVDNGDALDAFGHIADLFLLHNRDIYFGADDSIVRFQGGRPRFVRRSRGVAPLPIPLDEDLPPILACGAGLKNTFCLTRGNQVFLSQHIGDLGTLAVHGYFRRSVEHLESILEICPGIIAHDLHPDYYSSTYAQDRLDARPGCQGVAVQHHHAHAVSCMAENHLLDGEPVLAVTLDGTGLGSDGGIWGGEILLCTPGDFERRAHLCPLHMPGGEAAVREPWRMGAALLYAAHGRAFLDMDLPWMGALPVGREEVALVVQMMEKGLNAPLTTSCGRLFDGVASLLGLCQVASHEGQGAMAMEARALEWEESNTLFDTCFDLRPHAPRHWVEVDPMAIDMLPWVKEILPRIGTFSAARLSLEFHHGLARALGRGVQAVGRATGVDRVVLSGGVFNNEILRRRLTRDLKHLGFTVFSHSQVPWGDGGICLGQAVVAAARAGKK